MRSAEICAFTAFSRLIIRRNCTENWAEVGIHLAQSHQHCTMNCFEECAVPLHLERLVLLPHLATVTETPLVGSRFDHCFSLTFTGQTVKARARKSLDKREKNRTEGTTSFLCSHRTARSSMKYGDDTRNTKFKMGQRVSETYAPRHSGLSLTDPKSWRSCQKLGKSSGHLWLPQDAPPKDDGRVQKGIYDPPFAIITTILSQNVNSNGK